MDGSTEFFTTDQFRMGLGSQRDTNDSFEIYFLRSSDSPPYMIPPAAPDSFYEDFLSDYSDKILNENTIISLENIDSLETPILCDKEKLGDN